MTCDKMKTHCGTSKTRSGSRHTVTMPISRLPNFLRTGSLLSTGMRARRRTFLNPGDMRTSLGCQSFEIGVVVDVIRTVSRRMHAAYFSLFPGYPTRTPARQMLPAYPVLQLQPCSRQRCRPSAEPVPAAH